MLSVINKTQERRHSVFLLLTFNLCFYCYFEQVIVSWKIIIPKNKHKLFEHISRIFLRHFNKLSLIIVENCFRGWIFIDGNLALFCVDHFCEWWDSQNWHRYFFTVVKCISWKLKCWLWKQKNKEKAICRPLFFSIQTV